MTAKYTRDAAATAAIFAFFSMSWFNWPETPAGWRTAIITVTILAALVTVVGALMVWKYRKSGSAIGPHNGRRYWIIEGIELNVAALGAIILAVLGRGDYIIVWVSFVVGVHLFPLASLLRYPLLYGVAALITGISIVAIPAEYLVSIAAPLSAGIGTGIVLLAAALTSLITVFYPS